MKTTQVPSNDLAIINVALKKYAYSLFKKSNFFQELNLLRY